MLGTSALRHKEYSYLTFNHLRETGFGELHPINSATACYMQHFSNQITGLEKVYNLYCRNVLTIRPRDLHLALASSLFGAALLTVLVCGRGASDGKCAQKVFGRHAPSIQ